MLKQFFFVLLLIILLSFSVYSDTNGIWHQAGDVIGGVFGVDEQFKTFNYTFINPVFFNHTVSFRNFTGFGLKESQTEVDIDGRWFVRSHGTTPTSGAGMFGSYNPSVGGGVGIIQAYDYDLGLAKNLILQTAGGNVGIGTVNPTHKLTVDGNVKTTGNIDFDGELNIGTQINFPDGTSMATIYDAPIPSSAVMAFDLASCPPGWSPYPNANGRVIIGTGTLGSDTYALGDTGGSARHTLTVSEMPAHGHSGSTNTAGSHSHSYTDRYRDGGGGMSYESGSSEMRVVSSGGSTSSAGAHSHTLNINSAGGDQPHENRPAYISLLYCIKD